MGMISFGSIHLMWFVLLCKLSIVVLPFYEWRQQASGLQETLVALHRELKRKRWHSVLLTNVATIKTQLLLAFELVQI
jgi:hypothetical protein